MHVIASRPPVLEAMRAHGFRPGLTPTHPSLSRMHELMPTMLEAFGEITAHASQAQVVAYLPYR